MDGATANRHQPRRKNGRAAKVRQLRRFVWQVSERLVRVTYKQRVDVFSLFFGSSRLVVPPVWSDLSGSGLLTSMERENKAEQGRGQGRRQTLTD
ncbi:hypothetical protein CFAM422_009226 [Trichoderma lentiforme]|uniref:Uncharacterized protein n=1 Tax=Trichoderma lentiforme TaxID=1567552 RepID=A0A9P4XAC4_9HYPO|nr:hypothetical protein CFAM422_009226 [Trichoderma lentiforme]